MRLPEDAEICTYVNAFMCQYLQLDKNNNTSKASSQNTSNITSFNFNKHNAAASKNILTSTP
jgi:hypothetical protein